MQHLQGFFIVARTRMLIVMTMAAASLHTTSTCCKNISKSIDPENPIYYNQMSM